MKQKHIESHLSSITREFTNPKIRLEQYPTSVELTASIVSFARDDGDLGPGRTALDLGCGTGMLSFGCALVECDAVLGVDCDPDALSIAQNNAEELEIDVDFVIGKVNDQGFVNDNKEIKSRVRKKGARSRGRPQQTALPSLDPNIPDGLSLRDNCVDTVLTNPPFGTKHNAGIDVRFLKAATRLARRAVYSFHKTSTRDYLLRKISEWGYEARVVAELKFDLPQAYKFHTKKSVDIQVDLIRIQISKQENDNAVDNSLDEPEQTKESIAEMQALGIN
mmetsp:Transcript_26398/g.39015  ORF Transcript_26398/g.39015 Transcript_26398/m.39015 type:complete len:278 (-) Transcript_26398:67-900(-)